MTDQGNTAANAVANGHPLPSGWEWARLGDVCQPYRKTIKPDDPNAVAIPYLSLEHIESRTGRITRCPSDLVTDTVKSNTFAFHPGQVLYGKLRPYLNKVALPDFEGRCTSEIVPLVPNGMTSEFLAAALRWEKTVDHVMRATTGSRMPRTDMTHLMRMSLPIPPPNEQRRIMLALEERMEETDIAKRAAEAQLEAANALSAAYLRQVFPAEGDALPAGWEWVRLGDVCAVIAGQSPPGSSYNEVGEGTEFHQGKVAFCEHSLDHSGKWTVQPRRLAEAGDILMSVRAPVGPVNLTNRQVAIGRGLASIRANSELVLTDWVFRYLNSIQSRISGTQGTTFASINKTQIESMGLPLTDLTDQRRIVDALQERMEAIDSAKRVAETQLQATATMSDAYLRATFNGSLV